jgi:tetratricopeptide (TPR) repeat protein
MYQAIAHELVRERDTASAIADFRKALALDPNLPGIHYELGEALHSSPDLKLRAEAEEQYKLAIVANGSDAKAVTRLGDLADDKGDLEAAAAQYKKALAIDPGDSEAAIGLAHVYMEKDDAGTAAPLLEQVLARDPTDVLAHYRLSAVYRRLNRPEDAKRELAAYQQYKDMKEKMRQMYKYLRLGPEQNEQQDNVSK